MDGLFLFKSLKDRYLREIAEKDKNSVKNYYPGLCECAANMEDDFSITFDEMWWLIKEIRKDVPDGNGGLMAPIKDVQFRIAWLDNKIAEWDLTDQIENYGKC